MEKRDNMKTKEEVRKQVFAARAQVTREWVEERSRQIADRVIALPAFKRASRIFAYMDFKNEVMTRFLIEEAWKDGKEVAVPKVVGKELEFYILKDYGQLEKGCMGIMEPARGEKALWEDGLMIMPGVGFDGNNRRVGYGGGYYDRYLAAHPGIQQVAVAFDFQILEEVPAGPTDILPQLIVTESRVFCKKEESAT
ncbi:MAG: 5-formyltetrahydrofolate cyclo-ligase [Eubacteriales bacterium]|nr:5-formyltetrahydrofolate cyclo-ligase [Eubacteriales bacterium]